MERLQGDSKIAALKTVAHQSKVVPFEYIKSVGDVRSNLEENDKVIASLCERLGLVAEPSGYDG